MDHLAGVTVDDLHRALDDAHGKKSTLRLVAAIAYKHGVTQSALAEWLGVERKTIYNWLTRLERSGLESGLADAERPGRPRKLDDEDLDELRETLRGPPTDAGHDAPAWTTELVQAHVRSRFDVDYSRPSCRRLMHEAGLRYVTHREALARLDLDDADGAAPTSDALGDVWLPT